MQFPDIRPSPEAIMFSISATVLRTYIGNNWCDANLTGCTGTDPHLLPKSSDKKDIMMVQERIVALAEMVFNLQHILGSSARYKRLQNQNLEAAIVELEVAKLLQLNNLKFKFVLERKKKKYDYDILLNLPSNYKVCCEAKCKLYSTELTRNTVKNTLKKAVKQLPSTKPGLIFVKLPEIWLSDKNLKNIIDHVNNDFFRQNSRIAEIIYFWEETELNNHGSYIRKMMFREEINSNSRFIHNSFGRILHPISPILFRQHWTRFRSVVNAAILPANKQLNLMAKKDSPQVS